MEEEEEEADTEDVGVVATEEVATEVVDIEVDMVETDMEMEGIEEADMGVVAMEAVDKVDGAEMKVEGETKGEGVVRGVIISVNSISFEMKAKQGIEMKVHLI